MTPDDIDRRTLEGTAVLAKMAVEFRSCLRTLLDPVAFLHTRTFVVAFEAAMKKSSSTPSEVQPGGVGVDEGTETRLRDFARSTAESLLAYRRALLDAGWTNVDVETMATAWLDARLRS